jgi:hypothetical protein
MQELLRAILFIFTLGVLSVPEIEAAQSESGYPNLFKVFTLEGRESLTAACTPISAVVKPNEVNEIDCKFIHVRLTNPSERIDKDELGIPTSVQELARQSPEYEKELKQNPLKAAETWKEYALQSNKVREELCSPTPKEKLRSKQMSASAGPKRLKIFQRLIDACQEKDPLSFLKQMTELDRRTCDMWVDTFSLKFKKVNANRWLYQSGRPSLLSNVLKTYELRQREGSSNLVTLTETRVPVSGPNQTTPDEKPQQTVWSWDNFTEFELSCDFITHKTVQFPVGG